MTGVSNNQSKVLVLFAVSVNFGISVDPEKKSACYRHNLKMHTVYLGSLQLKRAVGSAYSKYPGDVSSKYGTLGGFEAIHSALRTANQACQTRSWMRFLPTHTSNSFPYHNWCNSSNGLPV
jgi:hypothetical protein